MGFIYLFFFSIGVSFVPLPAFDHCLKENHAVINAAGPKILLLFCDCHIEVTQRLLSFVTFVCAAGEQVKGIFQASGLPSAKLAQIW